MLDYVLNVAVSSRKANIRRTGSIKRKSLPLSLPHEPQTSSIYPHCSVRIPIDGSGFVSGGRTRCDHGVIRKTSLNLSRVQVWEVEWTDGQKGDLPLEECSTYGAVYYRTHSIHPGP
jgi:hypothetical protein